MLTTFSKEQRAHSSMWLWAGVVGISFPVVNTLSENLPLLLLTSLRFCLALLALLPFIPASEWRLPAVKTLTIYSVLGLCLSSFFGTMFWAAPHITSVTMSSLYVTVPLISFLLGMLINTHRSIALLPTLLTGACGALLLARTSVADGPEPQESLLGMGIFLLGCIGAASYPVVSKWGIRQGWLSGAAATRTAGSLCSGALFTALAGLWLEEPLALLLLTTSDLLILIFLGVFSTALTFWLSQYATSHLLPPEVQAYSYVVPLVSIGILIIQGNTSFNWQWLPGGALVLLCIGMLLRRKPETTLSPVSAGTE